MTITDIKPYERNAKKHSPLQIRKIAESIKRFGFNVPIVIDKENTVIAGHGRLEAAKLLGFKDVKPGVARAKVGERFIPAILVDDLTDAEIRAYRLADNKLNESGWNMELAIEELKSLSTDLIDLSGFDKDLVLEEKKNDDFVPEIKKVKSKRGDIYELRGHRLLCGDATDENDIEKLMDGKKAAMCFTDPPYNVDYHGGMGTHEQNKREVMLNDNMSEPAFGKFLYDALRQIINNVRGGCTCVCPLQNWIH
ncbi:MAG: ParB N-terminal domain-containing protein [Candidatus Pacebacteria bacterium]|nr:ParB N-terminal domain-containing protein [Candidatus Paceibacterota bacterium]